MTEEQTYRPQDDFYRYTNGEWLATHEIPADRPIHGTFHELLEQSQRKPLPVKFPVTTGNLSPIYTEYLWMKTLPTKQDSPPSLTSSHVCEQ